MTGVINFFKKIPYRTIYLLKALALYKNPFKLISIWISSDQKSETKLCLRNGLNFFVRKTLWDFFVINEILVKKEYSILEKDFQDANTIIDVGAHIGSFSVFYATKFPSSKVYSFEPMPKNFELLQKNVLENNLQKRIFPFNMAVVGKKTSSSIPLYLCEDNPACNSIREDYIPDGGIKISVKAISFAEIFSKNKITSCDILKLDCENTELEIISASKKEFSKISSVILEYHDPKQLGKIQYLLESYGFEFSLVPGTILAYGKRK